MTLCLKFFLLLLGLISVRGVDARDQCSQGPQTWCKNFITAKNCDQLDFCKEVFWAKTVKNDEVCDLCKVAINGIGGYISKNETKQKIKAALNQLCKDVPIPELSQECLQVIAEDFDMLYDEIVTLIANGDLVCGLLGLCKSSVTKDEVVNHLVNRMPALLKDAMKKNQLPIAAPVLIMDRKQECSDCEAFMHDIQNAIKNDDALLKELKDLMKKECDALGPGLAEVCNDETTKAINRMVKAVLSKQEAITICKSIKMCGFTSTKVANNPCSDCKNFFMDLENMIKNNTTFIDEFVKTLSSFYCLQEPSYLRPKCERYVAMVLRTSINRIIVETPDEICQAIAFCETDVSTHNKLPSSNTENGVVCEVCQVVASQLERVLSENSTEQEIITAVEQVCSMLPKQYQIACDDLVEEYAETMIKLLLNAFAPNELCYDLKLCSKTSRKVDRVSNPITCVICRIVIHELDKLIEGNRTEAAIVHAMEKVCSMVPGEFSEECKKFVDTYGADVVDMLLNEVESGVICTQLLLCSAPPPPAKLQGSIGCDLCEGVAKALDDLLTNQSTEQEIIEAVEKVCSFLPKQYQSQCDSLVETYGKLIIQLLVSKLSPQKLCAELQLCPQSNKIAVSSQADSETCDLCVVIATELDNLITENSTEEEITHAVEKVCSILPGKYSGLCDILIEQYGPKIIQALVNKVAPEKLCSTIGLCSSVKSLKKSEKSADSETCDLCVVIATELDNLLAENSTVEEITHAVEKVCSILPGKYSGLCDILIEQYGPKIIQSLVNKVPPEKLCSSIGLCSSVKSLKKSEKSSHALCLICQMVITDLEVLILDFKDETAIVNAIEKVCTVFPAQLEMACKQFLDQNADQLIRFLFAVYPPEYVCLKIKVCSLASPKLISSGSNLCPICELVATELDNMITTQSTQAEFEAALDKVCSLLPGNLTAQCDDFIASVAPAILKLLANEVEPSKLCPALHMCPKQLKANGEGCDVCKYVIALLDDVLESNATREDIEKALEKLCDQAPAEIKETCDSLVTQYTPEILDLADHVFDPAYVCTHLGLCGTNRRLIGTDHCTYGPAYWCKNKRTAAECKATEHCRLHVWN